MCECVFWVGDLNKNFEPVLPVFTSEERIYEKNKYSYKTTVVGGVLRSGYSRGDDRGWNLANGVFFSKVHSTSE
jgi:hypothetical protein